MSFTNKVVNLLATILLVCFSMSLTFAQSADVLQQQRQQKLNEVREIDKQLNANPSAEEYEKLLEKRKKLEAEIKDISTRLMSDQEVMKKINAAKKAVNDGNNAYKLGQYQEAVQNYDKAISSDSTSHMAFYGKGLALNKLRQYEEAIKAFKGCVRQNSAYANAYIEMGKIYSKLGQDDSAIKVYLQAVESDPSAYKGFYQLGEVYLNNKKDYNKAAQYFAKATQLNPEYDIAFFSLGVSLTELSRYEEALLALDNALSVSKNKKWHTLYYRRAVIYNKQGNYLKAKEAAEEALAKQKDYAPAAYEAGKACKELGQYNQALAYFKISAEDRSWKRTADYEIDLIVNRDNYGGN